MLLHRLPHPLTLTLTPTPFIPALNIRLAKPLQGEDGSLSFERGPWTRKEDEVLTLLFAKHKMPFRFVTRVLRSQAMVRLVQKHGSLRYPFLHFWRVE